MGRPKIENASPHSICITATFLPQVGEVFGFFYSRTGLLSRMNWNQFDS
jgi:hypothetical protein